MLLTKLSMPGADYDKEIVAGAGGLQLFHSVIGESLSIDNARIHVITQDLPIRILAADQGPHDFIKTADGIVLCVREGAPTLSFKKHDPGFLYYGDGLIGKYYLKELRQLTARKYEMVLGSAIYLLGLNKHFGGMYSGKRFDELWAEIVGGAFLYTIDEDIAEMRVYGYLPHDWRRENARKALMAVGAALRPNPDGSIRVTALSDTITGTFAADRVFRGASVVEQVPVTAVEVTEHNFIPSEDEIVLYENAIIATETITFPEPAHDLVIENGSIVASGVNYCTFTGSGAVKITGKKYIHITRIVRHGAEPTGTSEDIIEHVSDNTLIGPLNAVEIAENVYNYLTVGKLIKAKVVFGSERPGDVVKIINPFTGQLVEATFKNASAAFGATEARATGEFIVGYKPPGTISGFQYHQLLTGTGIFIAPDKNGDGTPYPARLILFGAGDGGHGGYRGENSTAGTTGRGGAGGNGGPAGLGGRVFEINFTAMPGQSYNFSCGIGGEGGAPETDGGPGTDTTFGNYSSALGRRYPDGYLEQITGQTFCANGQNGIPGGRGNNYNDPGPAVTYEGSAWYPGTDGQDNTEHGRAYGGGGGGAAVGNNGGNGTDGSWEINFGIWGDYNWHAIQGNGGNGANAVDADDATGYGTGGNGGHGGGGGGYRIDLGSYDRGHGGGYGGSGSRGGDGAPGAIMLYW